MIVLFVCAFITVKLSDRNKIRQYKRFYRLHENQFYLFFNDFMKLINFDFKTKLVKNVSRTFLNLQSVTICNNQ